MDNMLNRTFVWPLLLNVEVTKQHTQSWPTLCNDDTVLWCIVSSGPHHFMQILIVVSWALLQKADGEERNVFLPPVPLCRDDTI